MFVQIKHIKVKTEVENVDEVGALPIQKPRNLATIQEVNGIFPIEGADAIEAIRVLGWYLVAKKGEFKVGDTCVFFEVDAVLPEIAEFEFMRSRKFRVKTQNFRGQVSQGLAMRLSDVLPHFGVKSSDVLHWVSGTQFHPDNNKPHSLILEIGTDLTEVIGVKKYDPEGESLVVSQVKVHVPSFQHKYWLVRKYKQGRYHLMRWFYRTKLAKKMGLDDPLIKKGFPLNIPKTDETRVQNLGPFIQREAGTLCYLSEKCEGQSLTVFKHGRNKGTCSRNLDVSKDTGSNWVKMAEKYKLNEVLALAERDYAIQAEIIGPGVQGNIYELKELEIRVFYIYDIKAKRKLNYVDFISKCKEWKLPTVPILDENFVLPGDIDTIVKLADGKSVLNPKVLREGVVIVNKWDDYEGPQFSLKAISPSYELKKEEAHEKARKKKESSEKSLKDKELAEASTTTEFSA